MPALIVSCEHATNRIPARYAAQFAGARRALAGHAGWDRGAIELARRFAKQHAAPLIAGEVSRLLIDLNRSPDHPLLYSRWSARLAAAERERIADRWYRPYRQSVRRAAAVAIAAGPVLHLSVHSFAPRLGGRTRNADIGLLYDPQRAAERELALRWQRALRELDPQLRVRRNYPYRGVDDGLVQGLRGEWPDPLYAGIELEINQRRTYRAAAWRALQRTLCASLSLIRADE